MSHTDKNIARQLFINSIHGVFKKKSACTRGSVTVQRAAKAHEHRKENLVVFPSKFSEIVSDFHVYLNYFTKLHEKIYIPR